MSVSGPLPPHLIRYFYTCSNTTEVGPIEIWLKTPLRGLFQNDEKGHSEPVLDPCSNRGFESKNVYRPCYENHRSEQGSEQGFWDYRPCLREDLIEISYLPPLPLPQLPLMFLLGGGGKGQGGALLRAGCSLRTCRGPYTYEVIYFVRVGAPFPPPPLHLAVR